MLQKPVSKAVSPSGVADLFQTPSPKSLRGTPSSAKSTPHSLYAELPDTPQGPGEMTVSPLTSSKKSARKVSTPKLGGVKTLFSKKSPKSSPAVSPIGMKRMMKTPKRKAEPAAVSPSGVADIMKVWQSY